ncbi:MAG TPA: phosphatase PAP2 family protein [Candidatus Acidoferrum sp.]|jgi:undecaprenyl-diphosphatase|nr:phosphatase PAP2 family protein [Candidatus Acidoferrum sp.]
MAAEKRRRPSDAPTPGEKSAADTQDKKPKDMPRTAPVAGAGPVKVHVEAGDVKVVVAPPAPAGLDRRLYQLINGLPHTTTSDRYVSVLSDLGEGLGWVAGGVALAILGGSKGRRAGTATALSSLAATYVVQTRIKPLFRRVRPFVNREARVVGVKPPDHSFPSGHTASSFAGATALAFYYPKAAPLVYGLAAAVGASRVHLGVHFPSDAAVGGVIGIGIGTFGAWVFKTRGGRAPGRRRA